MKQITFFLSVKTALFLPLTQQNCYMHFFQNEQQVSWALLCVILTIATAPEFKMPCPPTTAM